jgi:hypothetical protein
MLPQYLLFPQQDQLTILHIASGASAVGYACLRRGKYHVRPERGDTVAIVGSVSEIIPALLDYREKHPAQWEGDEENGYSKFTHFGYGRVERDQSGHWTAYRNAGYSLLRDGKLALFDSAREAKRDVDLHLSDDLPCSERINDGLAWEADQALIEWSQL